MRKIKLITILLCIIIMGISLSACSNNDSESEISDAEEQTTQEAEVGNLSEFTTESMTGETVTQDVFKDYDLTMVNIWTTTCGYCIEEMPALEILSKQMPEKTNFISICADASINKDVAQEIIDESEVTFTTLIDNDELNKILLGSITVVPTTVFVNSEGEIVGVPKLGSYNTSDMEEMANLYLEELNAHLELVE